MNAATTVVDHTDPYQLSGLLEMAAAFCAATRVGVFECLRRSPGEAAEVARHCGTAPEPTRLLLDALDAAGVLRRDDDGRYACPESARWLDRVVANWLDLEQVVRTGRPLVPADTPAGAAQLYPEVVTPLLHLFTPAARRAAEFLAGTRGEVLDVGTGAGPWSVELARAAPAVRVTAMDLPDVLPVARRTVAEAGLTERFRFLAGDMFTAELPADAYDLILLGNVCHLFDPDTNRTLLRRLRPALRTGGTLAVIDVLPSDDPAERGRLSLYALGLRLRTAAGAVHPLNAYTTWAEETGYVGLAATQLSHTPPLALLTCTAKEDHRWGSQ